MLAQNGKVVSERHAEAKDSGMLTAGQIAKLITKKFGEKIKAAELRFYADEWHHSGFYKGNNGSTMGRTYFFKPPSEEHLQWLFDEVMRDRKEIAELEAEQDVERYFFETGFEKRYDGPRGRKRWQPIAKIKAVCCKPSEGMMNGKNMEISREDYELLKEHDGEDLKPYELFSEFKKRMLS